MAYKSIFELLIKSTHSGKRVFQNLQNDMKGTARESGKAAALMSSGWAKAGIAVGTVTAALFSLKKAFDVAVEGEKIGNVRAAFEALNKDATGTLKTLEKAFKGTLDVTSMQVFSTQLKQLGVDMSEMGDVAEIAFKAASASNRDVADVMKTLVTAMASGRTATLAQFGIVVDAKTANEAYADSLGVSAASLDRAARNTALFNAALKAGKKAYGDIPIEALSTDLQHLSKVWEDLKSDATEAAASVAMGTINMSRALFAPQAYAEELAGVNDESQILTDRMHAITVNGKELAKVQEELAARARDLASIFDDEGKKIADRIQSVDSLRAAMLELTELDERRKSVVAGLTKGEEDRAKALKISITEYARGNDSLATYVSLEHEIDVLQRKQPSTVKQLAKAYSDATDILNKYNKEQDPKALEEYKRKIGELLPRINELDSVITEDAGKWARLANNIGAASVQLDRMIAAAKQKSIIEEATTSTIGAVRDELDRVLEMTGELDTAEGRIRGILGKVAAGSIRSKEAVGLVSGQLDFLNEQLVAMGKGAEFADMGDMMQTAAALVKSAAADIVKSTPSVMKTVLPDPEDISERSAALQIALATANSDIERAAIQHEMKLDQIRDAAAEGRLTEFAALHQKELADIELTNVAKITAEREINQLLAEEAARKQEIDRQNAELKRDQERQEREAAAAAREEQRLLQEDIRRTSEITADSFALMKESGLDYADNLALAMNSAQEAVSQFSKAMETTGKASAKASASAISASGKFAAAFVDDVKSQALIQGFFETAAAIASLAGSDYTGAALHGLAAAAYFVAAGKAGKSSSAGTGAAASGGTGLRTPTTGQQQTGGGGNVVINLQGFAIGSEAELGRHVGSALNAAAGDVTLDKRMAGGDHTGF